MLRYVIPLCMFNLFCMETPEQPTPANTPITVITVAYSQQDTEQFEALRVANLSPPIEFEAVPPEIPFEVVVGMRCWYKNPKIVIPSAFFGIVLGGALTAFFKNI